MRLTVWRSSVRSALCAASQLPGREPTDVDEAPQRHMILPELKKYHTPLRSYIVFWRSKIFLTIGNAALFKSLNSMCCWKGVCPGYLVIEAWTTADWYLLAVTVLA